jgi:hypothetical protein
LAKWGLVAVEATDRALTVYPKDGLQKRLRFVEAGLNVEVMQGQIKKASLDRGKFSLTLEISDPSGLAKKSNISVNGLPSGKYKVTQGRSSRHVSVQRNLVLDVPIQEANHVQIESA